MRQPYLTNALQIFVLYKSKPYRTLQCPSCRDVSDTPYDPRKEGHMHLTTASPARARRAARPVAPGGKRKQAADDALAQVLGLFESGELPDRIAQTVIARQGGDTVPMASWSLGNQLLTLMAGTSDARGLRQWE